MKIKFWGTRGSIAVPGTDTTIYGGNTTCLEIILENGQKVIIDAGTGIRALGNKLSTESDNIDVYLLITHSHWDHVIGFPFFSPIYNPSTRLHIDGYPTCMKGLRNIFDNRMGDGFFPLRFKDLKAKINYVDKLRKGNLNIDNVEIDSIQLHHPQSGYGFRFREGGKIFVFITDNELRKSSSGGNTFKEYLKFCKGADILIHDAQYTHEEINDRRGWGHSDFHLALDLACKARVKKLILFHHDPSRTDSQVDKIQAACKVIAKENAPDMAIEAAREGSELEI